jgi:hypothetical protein
MYNFDCGITIEDLKFIADEQATRIEQFRRSHDDPKFEGIDAQKWINHMQIFLDITLAELARRKEALAVCV